MDLSRQSGMGRISVLGMTECSTFGERETATYHSVTSGAIIQ
jgi:hypothetical protein